MKGHVDQEMRALLPIRIGKRNATPELEIYAWLDTAFNGTFIGPELTALSNHTWLGVLGWDMPLNVNNSDLQITPSWRIRAALTYRF